MGTYEMYLLKSVAALSLLYIFYWVVLRNETYYSWNRLFLLFAMVISIISPAFSFSVESLPPTIFAKVLDPVVINGYLTPIEPETKNLDFWNILSIVYISGAVFFCLRFLTSLAQIHFLYHRFPKYKYHGFKAVVLDNDQSPFSFFNILFISKNDFQSGKIDETIVHERAHKEEFHTVDVLLMEIITIIQWFNPFIWMFRHSLRLEHEFIADNRVLLEGFDKVRYQEMLFEKSLGITSFSLTNHFNYSLLKKRLKMMTTKKSSSGVKLKYIFSMPLLVLTLVLLTTNLKVVAQEDRAIQDNSNDNFIVGYGEQNTLKYKTGEIADINAFVIKNLVYPKRAKEEQISARVIVQFWINENGKVSDVSILESNAVKDGKKISEYQSVNEINEEAIRVVKSLPDFTPKMKDGKNVKELNVLPIDFTL